MKQKKSTPKRKKPAPVEIRYEGTLPPDVMEIGRRVMDEMREERAKKDHMFYYYIRGKFPYAQVWIDAHVHWFIKVQRWFWKVLAYTAIPLAFFILFKIAAILWFKPDYSQPHEYLGVSGFGSDWSSMEGNDHWYGGDRGDHRDGLTRYKDNFFPIGNGKCISYLNSISEDRIKLSMRAFNGFLSDVGDFNDLRVVHAKLQCVEYLGRDETCKKRMLELAESVKENKEVSTFLMFGSITLCDRKNNIGEARHVSLE